MATFVTKFTHFVLVKKPAHKKWINEYESEGVPGEYVNFDKTGRFETEDPELIGWLRRHKRFNATFFEIDTVKPIEVEKPVVQKKVVAKVAASR